MTTGARGTLDVGIVGMGAGPITHTIDARWLMAYAAALGETDARYYDTEGADSLLAHPMFPVCYEWPAAVALRDKTVPAELQPQSVHATHHLTIHRAPRAGDTLHTTARILEVTPRRSGTRVVSRFETVDARGERVSTTDYGSVYRDVGLAGSATVHRQREVVALAAGAAGGGQGPLPGLGPWPPPAAPAASATTVDWQEHVAIAGNAAWVYTECARIWNPIHTDVALARRAGLSAPILHGTATLALAVSSVIARELKADPARVKEIRARFTGMVAMPSTLIVRGRGTDGRRIAFDAVASVGGAPILSEGSVTT